MPRVTKDPQIRMAEIIDTAEALFNAHGYKETQISDIVKTIGVAQGTFYYYFKSKEDVVEAIVRRKVDIIIAELETLASTADIAAPQKINLVIHTLLNSAHGRFGLLSEYLFNQQSLNIFDKLGHQVNERLTPPLNNIICEGIEQGCFTVPFPEEAVEFVLGIIRVLMESHYKQNVQEKLNTRLEITQKLIETVLGADKGSLSF